MMLSGQRTAYVSDRQLKASGELCWKLSGDSVMLKDRFSENLCTSVEYVFFKL